MSVWNKITDGFNKIGESLSGKKRADAEARRISLLYMEAYIYEIAVLNRDMRNYQESLAEEGIKEPFSDHPGFFDNRAVRKAIQVPRLFCKDILGNPAVNDQIFEPKGDMSAHIDIIMKAFTHSVGTLDLVCGKNAQDLLDGTLNSDVATLFRTENV